MTMHPGALTAALTTVNENHAQLTGGGPGDDSSDRDAYLGALENLADTVRAYMREQSGTWTVIGAWIGDEAIVTGVVPGRHQVYGGDTDQFPEGLWATSVSAENEGRAEFLAVNEMLRNEGLHDAEDDEDDGSETAAILADPETMAAITEARNEEL